jgi:predicted dehydrogenase
MEPVKLAVIGAGLIGKRHAEHIAREPNAKLIAVVDPTPIGDQVAASLQSRWFKSLADLLDVERPDGVVIATPNQMHLMNGLEAVAARLPAIVEKPLADSVEDGSRLVNAAEAAGVPLLVGHHRRYNPMIQKAREIVNSGRLGKILTINGQFWLMKPDDYFDVSWRRQKGAGPLLLNLVHDVDLFRYLCHEVVAVQAQTSNIMRGNEVEETAVILLEFASGVLGTVNVSDSVVAPWSWEMTTGENPVYPQQDQSCYQLAGTHGSLTIPQLEVWSNPGERSWWEPLVRERVPVVQEDPLKLQIQHFCEVIRGSAQPIVSGRDGLNTLKVINAVFKAAETGNKVRIEP